MLVLVILLFVVRYGTVMLQDMTWSGGARTHRSIRETTLCVAFSGVRRETHFERNAFGSLDATQ